MWNPVMVALMLGTYPIDDVGAAITVAEAGAVPPGGGRRRHPPRTPATARRRGCRRSRVRPWPSERLGDLHGRLLVDQRQRDHGVHTAGHGGRSGARTCAASPPGRSCSRPRSATSSRRRRNPYGALTLAVVFLAHRRGGDPRRGALSAIWWLVGIGFGVLADDRGGVPAVPVHFGRTASVPTPTIAQRRVPRRQRQRPASASVRPRPPPVHHDVRPEARWASREFTSRWFVLPLLPWLRWRAGRHTAWRRA